MGNFFAGLFRRDNTTGAASVEFWVMATTLVLLAKFAVSSIVPRRFTAPGVRLLLILNYYSVSYTLGLMSPSMSPSSSSGHGAATVNDFFQVWAVLIVTMQDSARIGRPYQPKEMTLVDLLTSLWSANELRSQTRLRLKVPLWFIWSIHASRIIWYYAASNRATEASLNNIKLVSDYMTTSQHTDDDASPHTMRGYRYIVVGEEEQKMDVTPPSFTLAMDLSQPEEAQLLTVDKVWEHARDRGDGLLSSDNRFKDVCLSFALYKLQRRRFYNFPIAEATHPATRRLVSDAILGGSYERALRITEVELSFLHDFFYSKHAAVFSGGFPRVRLALSLLMTAAALYLFYAVRDIPSSGTARTGDNKVARITHGVVVTHCVIAVVVIRELVEVGIYVLSQWTKVWIICNYIKLKLKGRQQGRIRMMQRLMMAKVARIMFRVIRRGRWDQGIRQYNLLMPSRARFLDGVPLVLRKVQLHDDVKSAVFQSLKALIMDIPSPRPSAEASSSSQEPPSTEQQMNDLLASYFRRAFGVVNAHTSSPSTPHITDTIAKFEGETHKILVWHIATSLCQVKFLEEAKQGGADLYTLPKKPVYDNDDNNHDHDALWKHYVAAVSLSNYCAYLVTQTLVPDNGLVATMVLDAVLDEAHHDLSRCRTMPQIHNRFQPPADRPPSILTMGAQLSEMFLSTHQRDDLWERLARFWAGFLLHLAASTPAARHQIHLRGHGELTTHLWLLLSHAGFLGKTTHGYQTLDPVDLNGAS